jgi:hypothetical protein
MEMHAHEMDELEQRLRAAYEPNREMVERVIEAAMHSRRQRPAGLIAVVALVLFSAALLWIYFARETMPVRAESIRLEYVGTVQLFEFPNGSSWIVSSDAASKGPDPYLNMIIFEGDKP